MSNNLELAQVAAAQNQKEVTINDQAGQLDAGLTDKVDVALTGTTSPLALSDAQACLALHGPQADRHASGRGVRGALPGQPEDAMRLERDGRGRHLQDGRGHRDLG